MLVNVNDIYCAHVCEQARWARSAGNSAIENLCIIIIKWGMQMAAKIGRVVNRMTTTWASSLPLNKNCQWETTRTGRENKNCQGETTRTGRENKNCQWETTRTGSEREQELSERTRTVNEREQELNCQWERGKKQYYKQNVCVCLPVCASVFCLFVFQSYRTAATKMWNCFFVFSLLNLWFTLWSAQSTLDGRHL